MVKGQVMEVVKIVEVGGTVGVKVMVATEGGVTEIGI